MPGLNRRDKPSVFERLRRSGQASCPAARPNALVRVTRAAICGSDLWPYKSMPRDDAGRRMGHEFIGVVEAVGSEVETVKVGDVVVSPFLWSDGSCVFCREGLQSSCLHGGRYGDGDVDGGQGEAVRVSQAEGTLVGLSVGTDDALMPSLPSPSMDRHINQDRSVCAVRV